MKVALLLEAEGYNKISFEFESMETASIFMDTAMNTTVDKIKFTIKPICPEQTEEGDEE